MIFTARLCWAFIWRCWIKARCFRNPFFARGNIREVQGAIIRPPASEPQEEGAVSLCPVTEHGPVDLLSLEGASGSEGVEPFKLEQPISDVEPFNRARIPDSRTREVLASKAKEMWIEEARPEKMGVQPLPELVDCDNVREFLRLSLIHI